MTNTFAVDHIDRLLTRRWHDLRGVKIYWLDDNEPDTIGPRWYELAYTDPADELRHLEDFRAYRNSDEFRRDLNRCRADADRWLLETAR